MIDIALRWHMAYGEATGLIEFLGRGSQHRYGIETGTKLLMVPPPRLVQESNEHTGLFQGVWHDANGRPNGYRFRDETPGREGLPKDYPAFNRAGMPYVLHFFDADDATQVRGISPMAAGFRKYLQKEKLDDVTLDTAILQTVFAATLTSDMPTEEALAGIQALKDDSEDGSGSQLYQDYIDFLSHSMSAAAENSVNLGNSPQISHLGPNEKLDITTTGTPGVQYLPYSTNLDRDMARAIGITHGAFTMNYERATYSSTRMESATIWPIAGRRKSRIAAPVAQAIFAAGLDEQIRLGRIAFRPGYAVFRRRRSALCRSTWRGPAKPSADDYKSARASTERIENGTSSIDVECVELGIDPDEVRADRLCDHQWHIENGMASPYERKTDRRDLPDDETKKDDA